MILLEAESTRPEPPSLLLNSRGGTGMTLALGLETASHPLWASGQVGHPLGAGSFRPERVSGWFSWHTHPPQEMKSVP